MAMRVVVCALLAVAAASAVDAKTVRKVAASGHPAAARVAPVGLVFRVTPADPDAVADRWLLDAIDGDYDREDPRSFRLRVRGAKVKMRVPLDLR